MNNIPFDIIDQMYAGQPYLDSEGHPTYIPCPIDRLLNAFTLVEGQIFHNPRSITPARYGQFAKDTLTFIRTIPVEYFQQKVQSLDKSVKSVLVRNMDKILSVDNDGILEPYYKALITH